MDVISTIEKISMMTNHQYGASEAEASATLQMH